MTVKNQELNSGTAPFSRTFAGEMLGATLTGAGKTIVTLPRGSPQTMGNPETPMQCARSADRSPCSAGTESRPGPLLTTASAASR